MLLAGSPMRDRNQVSKAWAYSQYLLAQDPLLHPKKPKRPGADRGQILPELELFEQQKILLATLPRILPGHRQE